MFTTKPEEFKDGKVLLVYGEYVTGGTAIEAWCDEGPYAHISINVPEIPCSENQIVLNHDICFDERFVQDVKSYLAKDSVPVAFGPFGTISELITLKDNWKDLCVSIENF